MRCENSWMKTITAVPDSKGFRLPSERLCCKNTHSVMRNLAREEEADTTSSHASRKSSFLLFKQTCSHDFAQAFLQDHNFAHQLGSRRRTWYSLERKRKILMRQASISLSPPPA